VEQPFFDAKPAEKLRKNSYLKIIMSRTLGKTPFFKRELCS